MCIYDIYIYKRASDYGIVLPIFSFCFSSIIFLLLSDTVISYIVYSVKWVTKHINSDSRCAWTAAVRIVD